MLLCKMGNLRKVLTAEVVFEGTEGLSHVCLSLSLESDSWEK